MQEEDTKRTEIPYPVQGAGEEFTQSIADHVQVSVEANMARFMPPENVLRYRHGEGWNIRRADASADVGKCEAVQVVQSTSYEDLANNDLGKMLQDVQGLVKGFSNKSEELMVETIRAAAESVGNEVSLSETGSWPEAFPL